MKHQNLDLNEKDIFMCMRSDFIIGKSSRIFNMIEIIISVSIAIEFSNNKNFFGQSDDDNNIIVNDDFVVACICLMVIVCVCVLLFFSGGGVVPK